MSFKWINLPVLGLFLFMIIGAILFSSHGWAFNGPHILSTNPCDVCHIPHHAADDMLWARTTTGPFVGVKRLCATCHGTGLYGAKDTFGIFEDEGDLSYDHVMGKDASINGPSVIREDWSLFPLKEKEGGDGFYCGSCHDPHRDPYDPIDDSGGGDYLRQEVTDLIKNITEKEAAFCIQCHNGIISGEAYGHGDKNGCYDCHHPHDSVNPGSKILVTPLIPFTAVPNCRGFTDTEETAAACYGCHQEGSGFDGAIAAPLAGDDLDVPKEHHPMGIGADASTSGHQQTQAGPVSPAGELYCESCHTVHDGTNDHYLNPQVITDFDPANSAVFCITCHSDKSIEDLGTSGEGHYQISPYNQCLFCHSIHNSQNDPDALYQTDEDEANIYNTSVSVDVFMRVPPENLAWADKNLDTDTRDYEDACYGCHASSDIVGREFSLNEENALLLDNVRDKYFSHRFNAVPSPAIKLINPFDDGLPIVSDGLEKETINDYGIEEGRMWCGSCHSVHIQNRFSTEVHEDYKERRAAYLRADRYGLSFCYRCFCYRCHTTYHEDLGVRNHPQDLPLRGGVPLLYFDGYSGGIGGITNGETAFDTAQGDVICQTCHSVHTAKTDWDGGSDEDELLDHGKLLVKPLDEGFCEDCHPSVHGGTGGDCLICHKPHNGIIPYVDPNTPFKALPNVPEINDDLEDPNFPSNALCYACHQPQHLEGDDLWIRYGAAPIYGDLIKGKENIFYKKNHHPMGSEARLSGSTFLRAPGSAATENLNQNSEITCISCHNGLHGGTKQNNFLRWNFLDDKAEFCLRCHIDKNMTGNDSDLRVLPDEKHFWTTGTSLIDGRELPERKVFNPSDPPDYEDDVECLQCMFCHFIHDGEKRDNEGSPGAIRADIDTLMRIGPKNLAWGDRSNDTDIEDYEDMCYGCHSDIMIVGNSCDDGALLKWSDTIHTHRFASPPDPNNPPSKVITYGGPFPLSDGQGTQTKNDYGTGPGIIYCGTCHNVHDHRVTPYLNEPEGLSLSPYDPYSFCEYCHDAESSQFQFVHNSHPIDVGPNPPATESRWPDLYCSGKSGCEGGVTFNNNFDNDGPIICLTCHNIHAAATNWRGEVTTAPNTEGHGKLLVKDNLSTEEGSDMCRDCHNFNNN